MNDIIKEVRSYKWGEDNNKLREINADLLEALQVLKIQYDDLLDSLYGKNISVVGWHLNGDHESFDNFIDDNDKGGSDMAEQAIKKATINNK